MDKSRNGKLNKLTRSGAYLPEILVLLLCAVLLSGDIGAKQGYHMDELLSFELANAEFNPWIVPTQPQGRLAKYVENELRGDTLWETFGNLADTAEDVLRNRGGSRLLSYQADVYAEPVWIDRQTFRDYITVGEGDAFHYLSVYFNVKDDNHPPLHFMALHTVSSVFRGQITPLMGCGINLVCVLGVMALLMGLGRRIMALAGCGEYGRAAGLWAAGLYGLSAGASSTTLLIRMYAMVTFFCVALLAIHLEKLAPTGVAPTGVGGKSFADGNKTLTLVTAAGFWTQYFFLFYCLLLAAVTAVVLWRRRQKKELVSYIRAMAAAAVIGVAAFPFSVADVFASGRGVEALDNLSSGLAGYGSRLAAFGRIVLERAGVGCVAALAFGLAVFGALLFANARGGRMRRKRAGRAFAKSSERAERTERTEHISQAEGVGCTAASKGELSGLLYIPALGYFLLAARMSPYLVDRYLMPLFPFAILLPVTALCRAGALWLRGGKRRERAVRVMGIVLICVTAACQIGDPLRYKDSYLYTGYAAQEETAREYGDYACICVYQGVGYYENLLEFTHYERTLLLTQEELEGRQDKESVASLGRVVVLLKQGMDQEKLCTILEREYGLYCEEILFQTGEPYGDTVLLFSTDYS